MPPRRRTAKLPKSHLKASASAPAESKDASRTQHWAIITYESQRGEDAGYYLDTIVSANVAVAEEKADIEVEAARERLLALPGLNVPFKAQVTAGGRTLTTALKAGEKKRKYDIWYFRRSVDGFCEHEVKLVKWPPKHTKEMDPLPQPPFPDKKEEGETEWQGICLQRAWMKFQI